MTYEVAIYDLRFYLVHFALSFGKGCDMQELSLFLQNHWTMSLALAALLLLLIVVEFIRQKRGAQQLSPLKLTHLMNHEQAVVVDLRPADAFVKGHIIGALSMPAAQFQENVKKLEKMKNRPIVLVCAKGQESPKMAASLKNKGFQVQVLGGGLQSWTSADMPLSKD